MFAGCKNLHLYSQLIKQPFEIRHFGDNPDTAGQSTWQSHDFVGFCRDVISSGGSYVSKTDHDRLLYSLNFVQDFLASGHTAAGPFPLENNCLYSDILLGSFQLASNKLRIDDTATEEKTGAARLHRPAE